MHNVSVVLTVATVPKPNSRPYYSYVPQPTGETVIIANTQPFDLLNDYTGIAFDNHKI